MKSFGRRIIIGTAIGLLACQAETTESTDEPTEQATVTTPSTPAPCSSPEFRQLDFWLGDWDLSWQQPDGTTGQGRNLITKNPFGDCVIQEQFDGAPTQALKGLSVSTYSAPHKQWRQTWVDNQGGYFSLFGGPNADGTFSLEMERLGDKGPYSRMVWEEIKVDSLVWRWQGKRAAEDEWADQWVINYVRTPAN